MPDLAALREPHGFKDSQVWYLTPMGLLVGGENVPRTSGGPPRTVRNIWQNFGADIAAAARKHDVPVELVIATIATESRGNPNAERTEPGFVSYQATPGRVSIGLMQTLISTAREASGNPALGPADLRMPAVSIDAGTAYIARQGGITGFDPPKVACAYNAGGLYHNTGSANRWRMRQYPIGTGAHADRFVAWFNDCFLLFDDPAQAPQPGFVRALQG
ncbi:transglycosylase-like protein with SLT domain [Dongia mobilis]|uniref:Transglycosylase-like protein with SLT domain n=1 Tax=Dongia mobilis TaxID=578943 RepID=A0A4R6WRB8_9PROT|nr:transglycosylase SLT domain-containing protein [Dongia mobilis]TDQ82001.1 transglycosylase-like protein with SLT domain [Dongia mobilis]